MTCQRVICSTCFSIPAQSPGIISSRWSTLLEMPLIVSPRMIVIGVTSFMPAAWSMVKPFVSVGTIQALMPGAFSNTSLRTCSVTAQLPVTSTSEPGPGSLTGIKVSFTVLIEESASCTSRRISSGPARPSLVLMSISGQSFSFAFPSPRAAAISWQVLNPQEPQSFIGRYLMMMPGESP